jgi:ubiquitin carboxyl-terminal hydrolase 25/28
MSNPSSEPPADRYPPPQPIPTAEEIYSAVPHPNAYYCKRENNWVIIIWQSSSVMPPLAESFKRSHNGTLPDHTRRKRTTSCVPDGDPAFVPSNQTHHFHRYEKAVDALKLTTAFRRRDWHKPPPGPQPPTDSIPNISDDEKEGELMDLYVCCQCSFYCVVSSVIPGVLDVADLDSFVSERGNNPRVGQSSAEAVVAALTTILQ